MRVYLDGIFYVIYIDLQEPILMDILGEKASGICVHSSPR